MDQDQPRDSLLIGPAPDDGYQVTAPAVLQYLVALVLAILAFGYVYTAPIASGCFFLAAALIAPSGRRRITRLNVRISSGGGLVLAVVLVVLGVLALLA